MHCHPPTLTPLCSNRPGRRGVPPADRPRHAKRRGLAQRLAVCHGNHPPHSLRQRRCCGAQRLQRERGMGGGTGWGSAGSRIADDGRAECRRGQGWPCALFPVGTQVPHHTIPLPPAGLQHRKRMLRLSALLTSKATLPPSCHCRPLQDRVRTLRLSALLTSKAALPPSCRCRFPRQGAQ